MLKYLNIVKCQKLTVSRNEGVSEERVNARARAKVYAGLENANGPILDVMDATTGD
jgi:hypothetical protein